MRRVSVFYPSVMLRRVSDISPEQLKLLGISALILDVDNTLTTHNNPMPDTDVLKWLAVMRENGIKLVIASNNSGARVNAFAKKLGLDYVARAAKPLPIGFWRVAKRMGLSAKSFGVVGDQIFTDTLGGNLFGAKTFLVQPMQPEKGPFFKLKRKIEVPIIKAYLKTTKRKG